MIVICRLCSSLSEPSNSEEVRIKSPLTTPLLMVTSYNYIFTFSIEPSFQIGFVSCMSMPEILLRFSFCQEVIVHIIISGISRWLRKPTLASCLCIFNWGEKQNLDWKCSVAGHFAYSRVWISSDFLHLTWFNRVRGSNKSFLVFQFHVQKTPNFSNPIMIIFLFVRTTRLDLEYHMIFQ